MTLEDLKRMQDVQKDILFSIVDICEEYEIEYFLMYGTLIGAVRHGGTIPWDYDIDIAMTRENYMKFYQVASKMPEWLERYDINIMGSGDLEYLSEMKIGRRGSKVYLPGTEDLKIMHQMAVDIFLLECVKEVNPKIWDLITKGCSILRIAKLNWDEKCLLMFCINKSSHRGKILYKSTLCLMHVFRWVVGEKRIEKLIHKLTVDDSGKSERVAVNIYPEKWWDKEVFSRMEEIPYEGRLLKVPRERHAVLENVYGDYMCYPPESERYGKYFDEYVTEFNF